MENGWSVAIVLVVLLLLAYPFWARALGRRRSSARAGKNDLAARLPTALDQLATSVDLATDVTTAAAILGDAVAAKRRKAVRLGPDTWGVRFVEADDVQVRLTATAAGSRASVVRTVEFQEFPQGAGDWAAFRERIARAALLRGVSVTESVGPHARRVPAPHGGGFYVWVAPDDD